MTLSNCEFASSDWASAVVLIAAMVFCYFSFFRRR